LLLTAYFTLPEYTKKNKMRTRWWWWWWIITPVCFHICHFVILLLVELTGQFTYILHIPFSTWPNFYFYFLFFMQPQTSLSELSIHNQQLLLEVMCNSYHRDFGSVDMIDLGSLKLLDRIWIQQNRCVWITREWLLFANFACYLVSESWNWAWMCFHAPL
jgi:hypothetical protein